MDNKAWNTVLITMDAPSTASSHLDSRAAGTAGEQLTPSLRAGIEAASWKHTSCL